MAEKKSLSVFLIVFSILILGSCKDRIFNNPLDPDRDIRAYEIELTLLVPGISPMDLTFAMDSLWVVDSISRVLSLNFNSGMIIREIHVDRTVNGICYDGADLWLTVRGSSEVIRVNIINGHVLQTLQLPKGDFHSIDHHEYRLYISDRLSRSILIVDAETGNVEATVVHPGFSLDGVAFDGTDLWTVDAIQMRIYQMDDTGGNIRVYQAPGQSAAGLAINSDNIWCGDSAEKIYKLLFQ
jgi:hypothetical protein